MPSVNLVVLIGTLTRDPEVRNTPGGQSVAGFSLAINHKWTSASGEKREDVTFVDVEMWGKLAELVSQYVKKGHSLYVEGRLQQDHWDDKTTGQKRSKLKVVGDKMQFLTVSGDRSGAPPRSDPPPGNDATVSKPSARKPIDPDLDASEEDDIPF